MIDVLIYDAGSRGQDICEQAGLAGAKEIDEVRRICNGLIVGNHPSAHASLRFSRMESGRYLLSLIKSIPASENLRAHNRILSLVLDQGGADVILNCDFVGLLRNLSELTDYSAREIHEIFSNHHNLTSLFTQPKRLITPGEKLAAALLSGASFTSSNQKYMIQFEGDGNVQYEWLNWLMQTLPVPLRRGVSFHTDIQSACDMTGVSLVFCSGEIDLQLQRTAYSGVERSDICFLRRDGEAINENLRKEVQLSGELARHGDSDWACVRAVFPEGGDWTLLRRYLNYNWNDLKAVFPRLGQLSNGQVEDLFALYPESMQQRAWDAHRERIRRMPDAFRTLSARLDRPVSSPAPRIYGAAPELTEPREETTVKYASSGMGGQENPKPRRNYPPLVKLALGLFCLIVAIGIAISGISAVRNPDQVISVYKVAEDGADALLASGQQVVVTVTASVWRYCLRSILTIVLSCIGGGLVQSIFVRKK